MRHRSTKDTKHWCKGVKGREHVWELKVPDNSISGVCRRYPFWTPEPSKWFCSHRWVCSKCGKQEYPKADVRCPDFREPTEEVEVL